ncbi:hypothetical protein V8F06_010162 [Rhypophila decipiens]
MTNLLTVPSHFGTDIILDLQSAVTIHQFPTINMQQGVEDKTQGQQQQHQQALVLQQPALPGKAGTVGHIDLEALFAGVGPELGSRGYRPPSEIARFSQLTTAQDAVVNAQHNAHQPRSDTLLVCFADGSALPGPADPMTGCVSSPMAGGYSVYQAHPTKSGEWLGVACAVPYVYDCTNSELLALVEALNMVMFVPGGAAQKLTVRLGNDSQRALNLIRWGQLLQLAAVRFALYQPIVAKIVELLNCLAVTGVAVEFYWLPGHGHQVYPHVLADDKARSIARSGGTWMSDEMNGEGREPHGRQYQPIGPALQLQVLELGRRHPRLDEAGRGHVWEADLLDLDPL